MVVDVLSVVLVRVDDDGSSARSLRVRAVDAIAGRRSGVQAKIRRLGPGHITARDPTSRLPFCAQAGCALALRGLRDK